MSKRNKALITPRLPRIVALSLAGASLLTGQAAFAQAQAERTGPDSFLTFQIESTDELAAVLRADPVLRRRYARHFGVSEDRVIGFVERALVPYRLPADRTTTVYGVTKTGRIYSVKTHLQRGTRVWATRSGTPILKWLCANPFTKTLPGEDLPPPLVSKPRIGGRVASLPMQEMSEEAPMPTAVAALTPDVPVTGVGVATASAVEPSTLVAGVSEVSGNLGALGLAFVPLAFARGGGGDTPSVVIPEPSTMALLAFGALPVATAIRRRRRRAQR